MNTDKDHDLRLLGCDPERLYSLINSEDGRVMGWSEWPDILISDGRHLTSHPHYRQFRRLEVRDGKGCLIARFRR